MPRVPKHREPIIDAAVKLFRRNGYAGTGLADIVAESGAPKGSLYHYFPGGKSSIAVSAVEEGGRRIAETLDRLSRETETTGELLRVYVNQVVKWMAMSGFRDGCPVTTVLLELAPQDRAVADAGRRADTAKLAVFQRKLVADGFSEARARNLALVCTSSLIGALVQARTERSGRPLVTIAEELAKMIPGAEKR